MKLIYFKLKMDELEKSSQWWLFYRKTDLRDVSVRLYRLLGLNWLLFSYKISLKEQRENMNRAIDKLMMEIQNEDGGILV